MMGKKQKNQDAVDKVIEELVKGQISKAKQKKLMSILKRINKDNEKPKRKGKNGSSSVRKHKESHRKTHKNGKGKKRSKTSKKTHKNRKHQNDRPLSSNTDKSSKQKPRMKRRQKQAGKKPAHLIRRNKWIKTTREFRQALRKKERVVYQVKYVICLLRYDDISWETHEDTFELPADLKAEDLDEQIENVVREQVNSLNRDFGYDVQMGVYDSNYDYDFETLGYVRITDESQLSVYLSNGVIN